MTSLHLPIKIGIVGLGNLGKGVIKAIHQNPDMDLVAVFTRRDPSSLNIGSLAAKYDEIKSYQGKIDVMILCGGSATDLPEQGPHLAQWFNTVDSYDNHARIPGYFDRIDKVAQAAGVLSLISTGWDPGLFSMIRSIAESVLPTGESYTFWGKGVSQGHSDAIRRVDGVKDAIQYTVPVEKALASVRRGENPHLDTTDKHERVCYVVAEESADRKKIEEAIKTMPNYFAPYKTTVHFISEEDLKASHAAMPHGGIVLRSGTTSDGVREKIEFNLALDSNPEFTSSVLVAFARAVARMAAEGQKGAKTVFDVPVGYLSPKSGEELRKTIL